MGIMIASTTALFLLAVIAPAVAQDGSGSSANSAVSDPEKPLTAMPSYGTPAVAWTSYEDAQDDETICQDRIFRAREQSDQPPLDESRSEAEPLMIWAVDRREDGCAVLVAKGDPDDIRPIPNTEDGTMLRPAG